MNLKDKLLSRPPKNGKFYIVVIDGRDGSGKTTLAEYMAHLLPEFLFLSGDDYFEPTPAGATWGEFNEERFAKDIIEPLKGGEMALTYRPYDWHKNPHISEQKIIIKQGVCIERCLSFSFGLNPDLKIWVETPREICFERGIARDAMPQEQAEKAWNIWQQQRDEYIARTKPLKTADIIIDGTKPFEEQLS